MQRLRDLFPRWHSDKELVCQAGDIGPIPGLGRSPGEGNGNPLQYSCLGNPMDRGAWQATVHGVAKIRTWLSMHAHIQGVFGCHIWEGRGCASCIWWVETRNAVNFPITHRTALTTKLIKSQMSTAPKLRHCYKPRTVSWWWSGGQS